MFDIMTYCETSSVLMNLIWYAVSLVADRTSEWIYLSLSLRDRFLFMFMLRNTTGAGKKLVPCSRGE